MNISKINKKVYIDKILFYVFLIVLIIFIYFILSRVKLKNSIINIPVETISAFQIPPNIMIELHNLSNKYNIDFSEILTLYSLENNFFDKKLLKYENIQQDFFINYNKIKSKYNKKQFKLYYNLINNIIKEIKNFPIPISEKYKYTYKDSWGAERTYGGKRIHQGTDIMDIENIEGRIPIVSMTDGNIEKIGWNEKGGYRIGIRTKNGNYYYYAHLNSYANGIKEGMEVSAGQLLGYMGNTGYSKIEGTKGKFEVHLHMGIEVKFSLSKEAFWINPYPFLNYIESLELE